MAKKVSKPREELPPPSLVEHRCPLKQKAAVIGILGPLTPGLSHALLALQEEDGSKGSRVVERRGRP